MKKILFVDDESHILDGLKRMLRPLRREWDMAFALSGDAALELLAGGDFDVIVSDMRMPGMDGAKLLAEVSTRHPRMVRIVLSGHSCKEAAMRAVGAAHQFLAKPCDADTLKRTIDRAFGLRSILTNESLMQVLAQANALPSMPGLYMKVAEELADPDGSIQQVGKIISQDPGMTAKILQLVNSAFFGLSRRVSIEQAVTLLGIKTLETLVLSVGVFSEFDGASVPGLDLKSVWQHSTRSAVVAKAIATSERNDAPFADEAMMAGLLHDTGKLILAQNLSGTYADVVANARTHNMPIHDAERQEFGTTHAEIGAYLLSLWGLPDTIVEAVALHHRPSECATAEFGVLTVVHVANALDHDCRKKKIVHATDALDDDSRKDDENDEVIEGLDLEYLAALGLTDRIPKWRDICLQTVSEEVAV